MNTQSFTNLITNIAEMIGVNIVKVKEPSVSGAGVVSVGSQKMAEQLALALSSSGITAVHISRKSSHSVYVG